MFPRFLHRLPKYRPSMPPKGSLQAWRMVMDGLDVDEVSFVLFCFFSCVWVWLLFIFGSLQCFSFWVICDLQMSLNPWLGCEEND